MLKLQYPIKPHYGTRVIALTQGFGENGAPFYAQMGLKGHNGVDFSVDQYQDGIGPVYCALGGYVISDKSLQSDTKGRYVSMISEETTAIDPKDGKEKACKIEVCYFHLDNARVSVDDPSSSPWYIRMFGNPNYIQPGVLIGYSDNTGEYTTGSHLHFHIRPHWKNEDGYFTPDYKNGYDGCIDPMPYFTDGAIYQDLGYKAKFWHNGKQISRSEVDLILNSK
jgi:murein DD-endopeptidase MepM/ murein hydrolase activator NlpD